MIELRDTYQLFINGEYSNSSNNAFFETHNPATGEVLASVAKATKEDVDRAVKAARIAFEKGKWPKLSQARRARVLNNIAAIMRERFNDLVEKQLMLPKDKFHKQLRTLNFMQEPLRLSVVEQTQFLMDFLIIH